jgi:2-(3-amino-3-carboxypropyl)histidine synthase
MIPIDSTDIIQRLRTRGARRVALQLPAGLRRQGFDLARMLRDEGFEVLLSGDPCYGACDLDRSAAALTDVLVHVGHAPVGDAPDVEFVPVRWDFDVEALGKVLPFLRSRRIGIVTTVQHVHLLDAVIAYLKDHGIEGVVAEGGRRTPLRGQILGCCFDAARRTGTGEILFVGTGVFHPLGIRLATGLRTVAFDPYTGQAEEIDTGRFLRRRAVLIEKARMARTVGIILSAKSGQQRRELARRLAALSERAVLILMAEVTPDELRNFGLECYVNTACPRLAFDDQERFPVPLVTPQEYEIALGVRAWEDYRIDEFCDDETATA